MHQIYRILLGFNHAELQKTNQRKNVDNSKFLLNYAFDQSIISMTKFVRRLSHAEKNENKLDKRTINVYAFILFGSRISPGHIHVSSDLC